MSREHDKDVVNVIPNSSFFVCFLDDIKIPAILKRTITYNRFIFVLCEKVKEELMMNSRFNTLFNDLNDYFKHFEYGMYAEILKPLFAEEEIVKGEHEVIVAAYVYHHVLNRNYIVIIDETETRRFIQRNFPEIFENIVGTLGFIKQCYSIYGIISKDEALNILKAIENSKFRVSRDILEKVKNEIISIER
ncbi:MAG: hypothetical protein NDF55_00100 [archaeon GB-1867-005]|nr:hypothetical protein [Candidatus Culexmicrobium cathedralense]